MNLLNKNIANDIKKLQSVSLFFCPGTLIFPAPPQKQHFQF